jgi:hypothetical protein
LPAPRLPRSVLRENVVICLDDRMTCVPAFVPCQGKRRRRFESVGTRIIGKLGIRPSLRVRDFLGILLDERNGFQGLRDFHKIRGSGVFLFESFDLCNFGAFEERLAIARNPFLVGFDHCGIRQDGLNACCGAVTLINTLFPFIDAPLRRLVRHTHAIWPRASNRIHCTLVSPVAVAENHAIVGWETVLGGAIAADRPQMAPSRTAPITFDNNFILSAPF